MVSKNNKTKKGKEKNFSTPRIEDISQITTETIQETPMPLATQDKPDNEKKELDPMDKTLKELEQAFFTLKFYPVAVKENGKDEAIEKIKNMYKKENDTVRQLVLYMVHEALAQSSELKTMYNFDFYRRKFPNIDPSQVRVNVYRSMFNYNFALEGMIELVKMLASLPGDDAAKLLSYHFSFLSAIEVEGSHMLRNAIIEALGESESEYALRCLLQYAKYTDNERLLQRIASSLVKWDQKIEQLNMSRKEKDKLKTSLEQVLTLEFGDSHYG
ncbi:hypothetical protein J4450_05535 [Candidatus Micrarchaeota archaeon]|nr:hypothetical protein [Candidatus Micrarchaeota archaeon]